MRAILEEGEEILKAESAGELLDAAMIGAAQRIDTMRLPSMGVADLCQLAGRQ